MIEQADFAINPSAELRERQRAVLTVMRLFGPCTDEELFLTYRNSALPRQSASGLRSRRAELVKLGIVEKTGEKRRMKSTGNRANVWRVV